MVKGPKSSQSDYGSRVYYSEMGSSVSDVADGLLRDEWPTQVPRFKAVKPLFLAEEGNTGQGVNPLHPSLFFGVAYC